MPQNETTRIEPSHIDISALADGQWGWVVWYGGDKHPLDQEGVTDSLAAALDRVKEISDGR